MKSVDREPANRKRVAKPRAPASATPRDPARDHAGIVRVIRSIPRGVVASYGEIATRAGLPGRARLVGRVLGEFTGDSVPWFRVLRSDGRIAFPPGSLSFRRQVRHLAAEGVLVVRGRVDLARHGWDRNLDAALWAPPSSAEARKAKRKRKEI
ncbi:MAG TPA: MGMT family protein [Rhodanobacteraceae bacterium]|nr:MGMT family protein [Rhodanobacteraceae bacterium]